MTNTRPAPLNTGVPFLTKGTWVLIILAISGISVLIARLFFGLSFVTNLDDQYPWGIWIAIDVATGVALAAGGFTTAFLAHVIHAHRYHALVRPALLTAMLGYTFVALGVCVDLGRYYNIWHVMLPSMWQGNSVLFEVGICVMMYLTVLYIEFLPIVCERFCGRVNLPGAFAKLNKPVDNLLHFLQRIMHKFISFFILAGVVLSCAHQSSLGSLMVIAPGKVHQLWHSPVLPLMFLLSAFASGLAMATFESLVAAKAFRLKPEIHILRRLGRFIPILLIIYFGAKLIDLVTRGALPLLLENSVQSIMFWIEITVGIIAPILLLLSEKIRRNPATLLFAVSLVIFGIIINRINVFIIAYKPLYADKVYVPAWTEVLLTVGFMSILILLYRTYVFIFPVLEMEEQDSDA